MRPIVVLLALYIVCPGFGQDSIMEDLRSLYLRNEFDSLIEKYAQDYKGLDDSALYYLGLSCFNTEDDENCLLFLKLSLAKGSNNLEAYFYIGMTHNYMGNYDKGIKAFLTAIQFNSEDGKSHCGLGDSYYNQKKQSKALISYKNAANTNDTPDRAYMMIAQIYTNMGSDDEALKSYYLAKTKISKETSSYSNCLYNIGLYELSGNQYTKAEKTYSELIELSPNDEEIIKKLIQVFYAQRQYTKAEPLKRRLYSIHSRQPKDATAKKMFCFDKFEYKETNIIAYEYFDNPAGKLYYKHIFYILDDSGNVDYSVQTESSAITEEQGGPKYLLGKSSSNGHSTYSIGFEEDFHYDDLKDAVKMVIDGSTQPISHSRIKN